MRTWQPELHLRIVKTTSPRWTRGKMARPETTDLKRKFVRFLLKETPRIKASRYRKISMYLYIRSYKYQNLF